MAVQIEEVVVVLGKVDPFGLSVGGHALAVSAWRLDSVECGMGLVVWENGS